MPDNSRMLLDSVRFVLLRDLSSLDAQVAAYPDDYSLWQTAAGISNSAGNLVLHLTGNLRHFIGATLGKTGYVRNRPAEFATKGLSRDELRAEVQATIADLQQVLETIEPDALAAPYPLLVPDKTVNTSDFLVHLAVHLTYHLGQIDYHRRLLTADPKPVENVSVRALPAAT
jgi:uncharacterized damage-inducible protein DinB